jgi:hypothetical protein
LSPLFQVQDTRFRHRQFTLSSLHFFWGELSFGSFHNQQLFMIGSFSRAKVRETTLIDKVNK